MASGMTRRDLLKTAAISAGVVILSDSFSVRSYAQNQKVRFANIAVGGRGEGHIGAAAGQNLVAICDTRQSAVDKVGKDHPDAKKYSDWRKLFDEMGREIDAVFCATPDHTHFPVAYTAIMMGKHCYCEKPLTHSIWEARTLAEATKKKKVATQMGNQGHAGGGIRRVVEWVQAGVLGEIKEIHTWTNRPVWPQSLDRPTDTPACPPELNWECFIGVAPMRPYHPCYQPFNWRGWYDFGCGAIGDMGCHTWDCVWWSMECEAPISAEPVKVVGRKPETFPKQMVVRWDFAKTAKRPGFVAYWYEGGLKPDVPEELKNDTEIEEKKRVLPDSGNLFIGTKGKLLVEGDYADSPRLIPTKWMNEFKKNMPPRLEGSPGHHEEFILACRGEKPWDFPKSNFTYAGPLVEAMNLANVAVRLDKKLKWDPKTMKCPGTPQADVLIKRPYRKEFWDVTKV
jgi:predicted dehydrogenase